MRGLGPLAAAFGLGYAIGSIIFGKPGQTLLVDNPGGWTEYICPTSPCEVLSGLAGPAITVYTQTVGVDVSNCICGQAISLIDDNLFRGYWQEMVTLPGRYSHVASFINDPGSPLVPEVELVPTPGPVTLADPWFREAFGPDLRINPGLAPVVSSPLGPEVGPWPSAAPRPVPGVGAEGYASGEPRDASRPDARPSPRPQTNPNPARPPKGTKERKMRASHVLGLANQGIGFVTESEDLLDAFHKAIKKGCSPKAKPVWQPGGDFSWKREWNGRHVEWKRARGSYRAPSYMEKWNAVYRAFDKCIDMGAFWKAYIDNQAEDALFGTASKDLPDAAKRGRVGDTRFGFELGPAL